MRTVAAPNNCSGTSNDFARRTLESSRSEAARPAGHAPAIRRSRGAKAFFTRAGAAAMLLATMAGSLDAQLPHGTAGAAGTTVTGGAREARGIVQRVTAKGAVPLSGAWVVLHRVGKDQAAPLDSTRTDADGRFVFRYRATGDTNALYFIASSYASIAYFTPPLRKAIASGPDANLLVYDTTSAPIAIHVRGRHVIVTAPDTGKGRLILEVFELSNDSTRTRVAGTPEKPTFESALPDGATNTVATDGGDIPADAVKFEGGRVKVFAPMAPGIKQLSIHYRLPLGKAPLAFPVPVPTTVLEVLVEGTEGSASGANLKKMASVNVGGRPFRRFVAQEAPMNAVVTVLPPAAPFAIGATLSVRMAFVIVAIGAVMLTGLAASLMRRGPLMARPDEIGDTDPDDVARQIAALDDAFEKKASPTEGERADHYQARARLKAKLTAALARRDRL
jgi:hypothetical protein